MRSFWSFRWFTVAFSKHITSWGVNVDFASEELEAKSKALSSGSVMGPMGSWDGDKFGTGNRNTGNSNDKGRTGTGYFDL